MTASVISVFTVYLLLSAFGRTDLFIVKLPNLYLGDAIEKLSEIFRCPHALLDREFEIVCGQGKLACLGTEGVVFK